jgi:thiol-disulfide isomerase/thioredoxin
VRALRPGKPDTGRSGRDAPVRQVPSGAAVDRDAGDTTFGEVAEAARIPVIVDVRAPWCGPCCMVSPALEQLARDLAGKVKLVKVNAGTSPQISQRSGAQAIPTLLVPRRGAAG